MYRHTKVNIQLNVFRDNTDEHIHTDSYEHNV